jgi:hypothetical protein
LVSPVGRLLALLKRGHEAVPWLLTFLYLRVVDLHTEMLSNKQGTA